MIRSALITTFGVIFVLFGLVYFFSPPANELGQQVRTEYSLFISGWFIISGLGLVWHYRWGLYVYLSGLAIMLVYVAIPALREEVAFEYAAGLLLLFAGMFGVPGALIWWKRGHLRAYAIESTDDA